MSTEIEAKLKVDSHTEVVQRLAQLGAIFIQEQLQKDCYFDDTDRSLTKTDRCLRLRFQSTGQDRKIFLTYKGPKQKGRLKTRQEIEMEITDADSAQQLLLALGYEKALTFEKNRRIWRFGDCLIALDELPLLGSFIEIEGPDEEKIADVQKSLGLAQLPNILQSYASLMAQKLHQQKM